MSLTKSKKSIYLIIFFLIVAAIVIFLLKSPKKQNSSHQRNISFQKRKSTQIINLDILKSPFFQSLTRYGKFPIQIRGIGRKNPFMPY